MNIYDILLLLAVAALIGFALRTARGRAKNGGCSCGGSACSGNCAGCSGKCAACPACEEKKK